MKGRNDTGVLSVCRALAFVAAPLALTSYIYAQAPDMSRQRDAMVANQVAERGVSDREVLAAMRNVPRHRFVPPELVSRAYDDTPLPIGHGQTISQPYIVGYMSELLGVQRTHRVL